MVLLLAACATRAGEEELRFANTAIGAPEFPEPLRKKLQAKWAERRQTGYQPRTRHLNEDSTPLYTNRLFLESSPYLLQHAHNPVNWYPWGDEAFDTARKLGRPVLLSVGYSTCHWCHVMEEESFEDPEVARYLNENYIAVKVDREERPDVDSIYMAAVQAFSGSGGWPMTVWLTPDRKPFFGGTYFPARDGDRGVRMGFLTLANRLRTAYEERPDDIINNGELFAARVGKMLAPVVADAVPGPDVLAAAASFYGEGADSVNGGMRGAPKFPSSLPVRFLLREWRRTGKRQWLDMAELTLAKMARGGIYDQVGGGFHRYSTDDKWLVPHFEKMLYDNALLAVAYLEGYQATGRAQFADVARGILRYVEREMTSPEGAFYSATDADSLNPAGEREEGWFFTWTPDEFKTVLGAERAAAAAKYFGVTGEGNFEGRNILTAASAEDAGEWIDGVRESLYQARLQRPAPLRDDKVLAAWNGLMISAHASAGFVLGNRRYIERGEKAAEFVLERMRKDGRLLRSFKDGEARLNAYLDDYAFMIAALLDLYEATGRLRWLEEARALDAVLAARYEDKAGGFYMTSDDHEKLLAREKPAEDGAVPSGNSVAALNLLRLAELTMQDGYRERAERTLQAFGAVLAQSPAALSEMLLAVDFRFGKPKEIVIVTAGPREEAEPFLKVLRERFVPNRVVVVGSEAELATQAVPVPLVEMKTARGGRPTAYVCERGVCKLPATDPAVFARQLEAK